MLPKISSIKNILSSMRVYIPIIIITVTNLCYYAYTTA